MPTFHFSLGPVQEFVNQARRTSDFWAGSFLLSWLAGVAMCAVRAQQGQIIFPHPPDDYLDWIAGKRKPETGNAMARVGAIPNRFSADVPKVFAGEDVVKAVRDSWLALAEHTLRCDGIRLDSASQAVWDRQIKENSLWEMQWMITPGEVDRQFNALDQRKRWRSQLPQTEPGAKCTLMHGWQELSGAPYAQIKDFWKGLRATSTHIGDTIGETETLCAHAWVKRRFEQHFGSFRQRLSDKLLVAGWELKVSVPSTHHLAALPWLEQVLQQPDSSWQELIRQAQRCDIKSRERNTRLLRLEKASAANPNAQALIALDAIAFFSDEIENNPELPATAPKQDLLKALQKLTQQHGSPSKFYALLLMDGDSLGKHIETAAQELASALKVFTAAVPNIVQAHSGFLVYAGGDDVLALLPLDEALPCAKTLRQAYLRSFATQAPGIAHPSISAALQLANYKTPLTQIINDAHHLLTHTAKHRHGRDSIAVRVWKGSGLHLTWGMPWASALTICPQDGTEQLALCELAAQMEQQREQRSGLYSGGFFQRAQRCYDKLANLQDNTLIEEMVVYEYGHSLQSEPGAEKKATKQEIAALLAPLLAQSQSMRRVLAENGLPRIEPDGTPSADAALLICFLLQEKPCRPDRTQAEPAAPEQIS